MTYPAFLFGSLISLLLGALFHFIFGGDLRKLLLYLIVGWVGFWVGHSIAGQFSWFFIEFGVIHLGPAIIGAIVFLWITYQLSLDDSHLQTN